MLFRICTHRYGKGFLYMRMYRIYSVNASAYMEALLYMCAHIQKRFLYKCIYRKHLCKCMCIKCFTYMCIYEKLFMCMHLQKRFPYMHLCICGYTKSTDVYACAYALLYMRVHMCFLICTYIEELYVYVYASVYVHTYMKACTSLVTRLQCEITTFQ